MPRFNTYDLIEEFLAADAILLWQSSSSTVKRIAGDDLAESIAALLPQVVPVEELSVNTTLSDEQVAVANSGSALTFTLPGATDNEGQKIYISNRGAGTLTVQRGGTDTIGGEVSFDLEQYEGAVFISVGNGLWQTFGTI